MSELSDHLIRIKLSLHDWHILTEQFVQKSAFPTMDVPAFQNNEKRQTTGAFLSSLSIICRFSISGALPQLFCPLPFLGHCPSFSALFHFWGIAPALPLFHFWGNSTHAKKSEVLTSNVQMLNLHCLLVAAPPGPLILYHRGIKYISHTLLKCKNQHYSS
jgi:hypothetical protein